MSQSTMGHVRSDIKRSEGILDQLKERGLSDPGKEWIIAAFDPFHDRDINCTGYPDANSSQSMLQVITLSTQISSSSSTNWDAHFIDYPFLGTTSSKQGWEQYTTSTTSGGNVSANFFQAPATTGGNASFGGLSILTALSSNANVGPFQLASQFLSQQNLIPLATDLQNPYRVIAKGFEVYNTSPDLYKSGAVCVYKQPTSDYVNATTAHLVAATGAAAFGATSIVMMAAPPATVSEALRLPNARQWDAKEGCYVISPLHHGDVPVHLSNYTQPMYYTNSPGDASMYAPATGNSAFTPFTGLTPTTGLVNFGDQHFTNFDQCGAIFTGLTPQSTLTVNYRLFIEVFPVSSSALSNFSKPSPMCDKFALSLYSDICHKSPVGVEVKFNGLGDWFVDGINAVKDMVLPAVSKGLKSMKHPGAQFLGGMIAPKKKTTVTGKGAPKAPKITAKMKANQKLKSKKASNIYG